MPSAEFVISPAIVLLARAGLVPIWMLVIVVASSSTVRAQPPSTPEALLRAAQSEAARGNSGKAVELAEKAVALRPKLDSAHYLLGREYFRLGKMPQSVASFDRYVKLRPDQESRQWERGIAYYYAGQFAKGAKQFELYQTFHNNDVENSVWRFLCMARDDSVEKARKVMLPIKDDSRIPMMEIFRLFRGELTPEGVLAAVDADKPDKEIRGGRMFYAHLYLGLYYEALGNQKLAQKYIYSAADNYKDHPRINQYMWDVARIHADQFAAKREAREELTTLMTDCSRDKT